MKNLLKRTGLFLQVRLNSKRLPGKVLLNLCGKSILIHVLEKMNVVPADVRVIVTTRDCQYFFEDIASSIGWEIFYGDEQNVLKRFVDAAVFYKVDVIIRATADNPLLSSEIAMETLDLFYKENCDLAYLAPVPYGSGVEIINFEALFESLKKTKIPYDYEHVTPYIYKNSSKYKIRSERFHDIEIARDDVRLSIDTFYDFEKINYLVRNLSKDNKNTKIKRVIKIYDELDYSSIYKRILFITGYGNNYGMGHLKRTIILADKLKKDFLIYYSFYNSDIPQNIFSKNDYKIIPYNNLENFVIKEGVFDRVIVDLRDTLYEDMKFYKELGPVISLDDMGVGGQISDINICALPRLKEYNKNRYNFDGLEYLIIKKSKIKEYKEINNPPKNILITFGGSDPQNLSRIISTIFVEMGYKVTLIVGPVFNDNIKDIESCEIIRNVDNLNTFIEESDLVVSSFGLTFFESLISNKPVFLINPTNYHDKLTEEFGYPYFLKREREKNKDKDEFVELKNKIEEMLNKMIDEKVFLINSEKNPLSYYFSLKIGNKVNKIMTLISKLSYSISICPNCSFKNEYVLYRNEKWNMYKCKKCGLRYIKNFYTNENKDYNEDYFLSEYKNKYGKTYEEDRENIINFAKERINYIKKYIEKGKLLDFGSGLGFFAEYSEKNGYETLSVDKSKYAVDFIIDKLNLMAIQSDYDYLEKTDDLFDVITSFFVIEHVKDFKKLLFLFKCHLKDNGVIALSTPNLNGISIKYNFLDYIKNHPEDHYVIFSPKLLKRILKKFGFKNFKVVIKGIHVEKFIKSKKINENKIVKKIIYFFAKLFQLGDTFEIYARKKKLKK